MKNKKIASLEDIFDDAAMAVAEYAKWPTVAARVEIADREVGYLREALRGYDPAIYRAMIPMAVARTMFHCHNLDLERDMVALRRGLLKLADVLAPDDTRGQAAPETQDPHDR